MLDAITLIDYFHAAVSPNPYYGIDWQTLAATPSRSSAASAAPAASASSASAPSASAPSASAPPAATKEAPTKKAEVRETATLGAAAGKAASKGSRESVGGGEIRETAAGGGGGGGAKGKTGGFTYKETYDLYNQQLHYARSHYTTPQLNAWQTDWNKYFNKHGMDIPVYAHKVVKGKGGKARASTME